MSDAAAQVPAKPQSFSAKAYAVSSPTAHFAAHSIARRAPRPQDVQIEILFCGVCHSDLHTVRDEWKEFMPTVYPCVPGHEIVGRVVKVGSAVKKFKEGDMAAVGCMVDSCRECESCRAGLEQYCEKGMTLTYNGEDKFLGGVTYGGYSDSIVVDEATSCACPTNWIPPVRRRFFAPASPPIPRCATGRLARARKLASLVSVDWATWA